MMTNITKRLHKSPLLASLVEFAPALLVLFLTVAFTTTAAGLSFVKEWHSLSRAILRFLRFTVVLCLPLYGLLPIYSFIVEKRKEVLLQIREKPDLTIHPLKHWLFRPFQGIGISLLFATKLLTVLQLIAGPTVKLSLLIPQGRFELARLLMTSAITIFVSFLLSTLWTLDDVGIRYFNRKDQELKMIGKYAGTLMPTIFGLYGMLGLLTNYPTAEAFTYAFKIVVFLYPPLGFFVIAHTYFLRKRAGLFSTRTSLKKGVILLHE
jgi:hypothetical protein